MRSDKKIILAFGLNFLFSVVEFLGGVFTGSIAIISDALHDLGDAAAIAVSAFLERKSKRPPDKRYTYGYGRYSVIGGAINAMILLAGSVVVVCGAIGRLISPSPIHYDGMLMMAVFGVIVNSLAAYATHGGESMNQKAVNLHMLEDVLGWVVVLVGATVMRFTNWWFIDPLMSIGVSIFIFLHATKHLKQIGDILLEKAPGGTDVTELEAQIVSLPGVAGIHHIHLWSIDGETVLATMHIVTNEDSHGIKDSVRHVCKDLGIEHVTLETERITEHCHEKSCNINTSAKIQHHHHHHA